MSSKKSCAKCNKRHFKHSEKCQCGSVFFVSDVLVVSEHYKEGMSGEALVRHLCSLGFSISQPVVLDRMRELGIKNEREVKKDRQKALKEYLHECKTRPSGVKMAKKFDVKEKTAYNIICQHFGHDGRWKTRVSKSEKELLNEYMKRYTDFISLPLEQQTIWKRNALVCEINTLRKYKMI